MVPPARARPQRAGRVHARYVLSYYESDPPIDDLDFDGKMTVR